jgi:hypothetical protein
MFVKLNKRSDRYLCKNRADKGDFGTIVLEYVSGCVRSRWSLRELGEIDDDEYDEDYYVK